MPQRTQNKTKQKNNKKTTTTKLMGRKHWKPLSSEYVCRPRWTKKVFFWSLQTYQVAETSSQCLHSSNKTIPGCKRSFKKSWKAEKCHTTLIICIIGVSPENTKYVTQHWLSAAQESALKTQNMSHNTDYLQHKSQPPKTCHTTLIICIIGSQP